MALAKQRKVLGFEPPLSLEPLVGVIQNRRENIGDLHEGALQQILCNIHTSLSE